MSASLVGSEMCIRDSRPRGEQDVGALGLGGLCCWDRAWLGPGQVARWRRCLLYTSDAADDM
eukprot:13251798-Alexandrium_andersonii.AAC.1